MNRNILTIAVLAAACCPAFSQSGVVSVRPANDPSGKMLTMEDAILNGSLSPRRYPIRFKGCDSVEFSSAEGTWTMALKNGRTIESKWQKTVADEEVKKWRPFCSGSSLRAVSPEGDTLTVAASERDGIVYGQTVSRNEFGIDGGIFPSPDGKKLAFYRKDESRVTLFPLLDITTRTGSLKEIRYPMAGMDSEEISLGI